MPSEMIECRCVAQSLSSFVHSQPRHLACSTSLLMVLSFLYCFFSRYLFMLQPHLLETQAGIRAPLCQVLPRPNERQSLSPAEIGTQACRALARHSQRRSLPLRVYKQTKGGRGNGGTKRDPKQARNTPCIS